MYENEEVHADGTVFKSPLSCHNGTSSKGAQKRSSPRRIYPLSGRTISFPLAMEKTSEQTFTASIIRKDSFLMSASATNAYLFGRHVGGRSFVHRSFHGGIVGLSSDQAKVSDLHHFIAEHDVFRLQRAERKKHQPQDCRYLTAAGSVHLTFRSLWMNLLEWMYSTPLTICMKMERPFCFLCFSSF